MIIMMMMSDDDGGACIGASDKIEKKYSFSYYRNYIDVPVHKEGLKTANVPWTSFFHLSTATTTSSYPIPLTTLLLRYLD